LQIYFLATGVRALGGAMAAGEAFVDPHSAGGPPPPPGCPAADDVP